MMSLFCLIVAMALPFTTPAYEVTVEKNVAYTTAPGYYTYAPIGDKGSTLKLLFHSGIPKPVTLEMDIYKPAGADTAPRPLLLMMHGGSFFIGNSSGKRSSGRWKMPTPPWPTCGNGRTSIATRNACSRPGPAPVR